MTPTATTTLLYGGRVKRRDWTFEQMTEEQARAIIHQRRWPQGRRCPQCNGADYYVRSRALYRCANPECRADYWEGTGTIMQGTKFKSPCRTWLAGEQLFHAGASYKEMTRALNVSSGAGFELWHRLNNNGGKLL